MTRVLHVHHRRFGRDIHHLLDVADLQLADHVGRSVQDVRGGHPAAELAVDVHIVGVQVVGDAHFRSHALAAFVNGSRAKDYKKAWQDYNGAKDKKGLAAPRRDLELEALVEILENRRFITCHSYVQSEINSSIKIGEQMGYKYNTFTHILEGYKVADKMKAHGAHASTFSDWWAYKMEVQDAIPYNAAIMHRVGLNVAINSDDAEMARRLNQEAAKIVKYGGVSEEEALKMVTLNPARMLHVDDRVGSLKVGKDGDVVLWSEHPLSIYAKALYTIVDGTVYFDRQKDEQLRLLVDNDRNRIIRKLIGEKRTGAPVQPPVPSYQIMHTCSDHYHSHGLLTIDADELEK